jgi:transposase
MREQKKRTYTPEFKKDALRSVNEQRYKVPESERNLRIHSTLLKRWKTELASTGPNTFPGKGRLRSEQEELQRLRKENQQLRMERDILKRQRPSLPTSRGKIRLYPAEL